MGDDLHKTTERPRITAARMHQWLDTGRIVDGAFPVRYGVQVRAGGKWHHLALNGAAVIYDTPEEAQAQADEVMRQVAANA